MPNKPLLCVTCAATVVLSLPSAASAGYPHVVSRGESLYSVAAADGLSVAELAAANGLSSAAPLIVGATLMIPPRGTVSSPVAASTPSAAVGSSAAASSAAASGTGSSGGGYVVQPGDTLSAIAARSGVPVAQLAAANGLDATGILRAGRALHVSGGGSGTTVPVSTTAASGTESSGGGYVVQPGDTLSAIASRSGMTVAQLAAANGLAPNGMLRAGRALQVAGGGSSTTVPVSTISTGSGAGQPVGVPAQGVASAPPYPTPERVTASQVGQIASANGVSPSLAAAIGWQESGFNNDLVSTADARGVMQILPGTWDWIQRSLTAGVPLAPASAASNVRGGVLMLRSLLSSTGGDPALAAAGYYQGLSSVRAHGMYSDTQNYVNSVMALRYQFGGGG